MQTDVVALIAVFGTISFITWTIFSSVRKLRMARIQADVQTILLSRFDSAQNMAAYAQTEAGKQFLTGIRFEHETPFGPMLACVRWGIVDHLPWDRPSVSCAPWVRSIPIPSFPASSLSRSASPLKSLPSSPGTSIARWG